MENGEKYIIKKTKDNEVLVKFLTPMDSFEWNRFTSMLVRMLKNGFLKWKFILTEQQIATSVDIGMWVSCNATINSYKGELVIIVLEGSTIHKTLVFTKLDKILNISILKKN